MANSAEYLLKNLVTPVLLRLPVKSLLRFKSVSKSWLSMISSPGFIKSHLNSALIAARTKPTLLVIEYPCKQAASGMEDSLVRIDCVVIPRCFVSSPVVGTCNGIICLDSMHGAAFCLWNPCTNMCKRVLAPSPGTGTYRLGFGYDCVAEDYKVVRIVYDDVNDVVPRVQVYSSKGDCWRQFQDPVLSLWKPPNPYGRIDTVVNGVLYMDCYYELMAFDFHQEVFRVVSFPMDFKRKRSDVLDYEGSVAMVFESGVGSGVDLWTLDDVCGGITWTKRFSVRDDWDMWLSSYLGLGQFHGGMSFDQTCYLYDSEKKELRFYRVRENQVCATLRYTESLVSFDGFQVVQKNGYLSLRDGRTSLEADLIKRLSQMSRSRNAPGKQEAKDRHVTRLKDYRERYRTNVKKPDTDFFTSD